MPWTYGRMTRHGNRAGPIDRSMRRPGQLPAEFEPRQFQVAHDLLIVEPKVITAARRQDLESSKA
jgi:hypothetical protein